MLVILPFNSSYFLLDTQFTGLWKHQYNMNPLTGFAETLSHEKKNSQAKQNKIKTNKQTPK